MQTNLNTPARAVVRFNPRCATVWLALLWALLFTNPAMAIILTNDTVIPAGDSSYDGQDLVIGSCTVTVDGPHAFANVLVTSGGILTHSPASCVFITNRIAITNELHTLESTNPVALLHPNIFTATVHVTDESRTISYTRETDYWLSDLGNGLTGLQRTPDSAIPDIAMVRVSYEADQATVYEGLNLVVSGHVAVATGGAIFADGKGYAGGEGPGLGLAAGTPHSGSGAGHGGFGGMSSSNAPGGSYYGSTENPSLLGSGGGAGTGGLGGAGGGTIKLTVGGNLTLNGCISADGFNGVNNRSGGGSGGSIWITADNIAGNGTISANGGNGEPIHGGGGGGGRIALEYASNDFTGTVRAHGGTGFQAGGAGTVFTKLATATGGTLVVDNGGSLGAITPFIQGNTATLIVTGGAVVCPFGNPSLASLAVGANGWLSPCAIPGTLDLTVSGDAVFAADSGINAVGKGSLSGQGNGAGVFYSAGVNGAGGGGGHAGYGGMGSWTNFSRGGGHFGSVGSPSLPGSGGGGNATYPGGAGGGAVRLNVGGQLQLDGSIRVDGERPVSNLAGGGAGGSVWVTTGTFAGNGQISANGGSAYPPNGGGGSGGRVAVYFDTNLFAGTIRAAGGLGFQNGAAGTIYTKTNSASIADLLVDNNGIAGTNTFFNVGGIVDVTVQGRANIEGTAIIQNLIVRSNSLYVVTNQTQSLYVLGDAIIEPRAGLSVDGRGSVSNQGMGAGRYSSSGMQSSWGGGGGGHAGFGGDGFQGPPNASGGNGYYSFYNSVAEPIRPGSGGGGTTLSLGGTGGGALRLTVFGLLQLDGRISADGLSALGGGAGGGSGGSLWLTLNRWQGGGVLSANGGAGDLPNGGGGGGGRVAVTYASNAFSGMITARGAPGCVAGGAGTVYLKQEQSGIAQLTVDNGGVHGAHTTEFSGTSFNMTLCGGSSMAFTSSYPSVVFRELTIGSNSWIVASARSALSFTVNSNLVIETGGGISVDGWGSIYNSGTGAGRYYSQYPHTSSGGGGAHGGFGGSGAFGGTASAGGEAYDYGIAQPNMLGSGGGNLSPSRTNDSAGGGAIRLNVPGLLHLDGVLTANGSPGSNWGAGGGGGGSIWLNIGRLSGSGRISANGGGGDLPNGGGGGGGRIAIHYASNDFTGTISAMGGNGFIAGGAGTIFFKRTNESISRLLVDNGGLRGTNTLVYSFSPSGDMVVQGGAVAEPDRYFTQILRNVIVHPQSSIVLGYFTRIRTEADVFVASGASINADGLGHPAGYGAGAGVHSVTPKGGGSHGGLGGANPSAAAFGSVNSPSLNGSGGANGSGQSGMPPFGGAGGGVVNVDAGGRLTVHGRISANGTDGGLNSGGGAGGSVWLTAGTLAGTGLISANGGTGNGTAGGGGGGRVALQLTTNLFTGSVTAFGGAGSVGGGAGTVYWQQTGRSPDTLVVDNGGLFGTNTPLVGLSAGMNVNVAGGAVVHPQVSWPRFNAVNVGDGGVITHLASQSNLQVATTSDLNIEAGGALAVDGKGFAANAGNGPGGWVADQGGGGGHGGPGGASASGAAGGLIYGSETQPADRGSGGGALPSGGSEGGGAIRLSVGGVLNVDGSLSADGHDGWQDDAGGGAGGSIWITANALTGGGTISAKGGAGEWFNGGGGGGGRIALYSPANTYTGLVSAVGGPGANSGGNGTVIVSATPPGFQVTAQAPSGVVSNTVSSVKLTFNEVVDMLSVTKEDFVLITPAGPLPQTNLWISASGLFSVQVGFPMQHLLGDYRIEAGPGITNIFVQPMSGVYSGDFTIVLPAISGTVTDTNGQPVAGVVIQPSGGWQSVTTDVAGRYALGVPPGWSGSIAPVLGNLMFAPGSRAYTNVIESVSRQDYVALDSIAPQLVCGGAGTNVWLRWSGVPGVTYQVWASTNLTDWLPWGEPMPGTNGLMQVIVPGNDAPARFFRLQTAN